MNTKARKTGARLGALLLSLCMIMGLMPMTANAEGTDPFIFGYQAGAERIISVSTADQSDYTQIADYDGMLLGLEMINGTIYGLSSNQYSSASKLVILNPDFTLKETVGDSWSDILLVDTTVQNGTLWGTYNESQYEYVFDGKEFVVTFKSGTSYLIPVDLTTGQPDYSRKGEVTGLPSREIIYTIACNADGQMYAIVADGGDNGGVATLYTIDTTSFVATRVGSTDVITNYISSSTFAPDGTLYWAENNVGKLYKVNTSNGTVTAVSSGTIGGNASTLNAIMIPSNGNTVAYVDFTVKGEEGSINMSGQTVTGLQEVTAGSDLALTFIPGYNNRVKEVRVNGEKQEFTGNTFSLADVEPWCNGIQTVEVTFQSKNIRITSKDDELPYLGKDTLTYHPTFEAALYFNVENGPVRQTAGVSNYQISIEKNGEPIDKADLVPGTYDIHVTREADEDWNALDTVLKDGLVICRYTYFPLWYDLEITAHPGDTLADIQKPDYLVSSLDGKQIPGTFYWIDEESIPVGDLGDKTGFTFRFIPDLPLSAELSTFYDFSGMPKNGYAYADPNYPFTAYVKVVEDGTSAADPISLPVRVLEEGDVDYSPAPELSATFTPDTTVPVGEFNQWQGLAIDYYNPMVETEWYEPVSEGYDIQAEYTVSIPLTDYEGETLSGTLTLPLPQGYDGATARIKGGAAASSYTADTVSFPVTLDVSYGTAEVFGLLIEYKEAQEPVVPDAPVIIAGANGTWQQGSKDGLSFTSNAEFADFIKVQVDGKDLAASNYTMKEGSTIVTLNADYLNTLSVDKHTLSIVSANGSASTEFTITAAQAGGNDETDGNQTGGDTTPQEPDKNEGNTTSPQTGDGSNILWIALLLTSGAGVTTGTILNQKRRRVR